MRFILSIFLCLMMSGTLHAKTGNANAVPDKFKVLFETTKGNVTVEVVKKWAPLGAKRFHDLVKSGYFKDIAFFRVISGFMAQFGIHGDPNVSVKWRTNSIKDDQVKASNKRGYLTFATAGKDSRTTQLFINFGDNSRLDRMGFAPIGKIDEAGMKVIDKLYSGYGEGHPAGSGPHQGKIQMQGNSYLKKEFPMLDYIKSAKVL